MAPGRDFERTRRFRQIIRIGIDWKPFYLRGDFDGDSKPDYAVLVVNLQSKKSAIAIYLSSRDRVEVLGAGGVLIRVGTKKRLRSRGLLTGWMLGRWRLGKC